MKKTLADFKQEVAEREGCLVYELEQSQTDEAAERYAEYKAKEAMESSYYRGIDTGHKQGWNEALELAAVICRDDEYEYNKHAILERLKP